MIDLSDITFIIPLRLDSMDRLVNLKHVIMTICQHFKTNIILLECDSSRKINFSLSCATVNCEYLFIEDKSPLFHRTKLLNIMIRMAKTPYVANYDCDVILPIPAYAKAYSLLKEYDVVYPYGGMFLNIKPEEKKLIVSDGVAIESVDVKKFDLLNDNSVGGALFVRRDSYIKSGLENEYMVSFGPEDAERFARWKILGYKIARLDNPLYHLCHPKLVNSCTANPAHKANEVEYEKVRAMKKEELIAYIKTWPWAGEPSLSGAGAS